MSTLAQGIGLGSLLLVSTAGITFGNNLLENHRFQQTEQGLPKVGAASTWSGEAKFEISSDGFHDQSSLMISSDRGADASWGQKVTLKPFTRYKLWGFIKTEGVKGEGLGAVFNIHGTEFKTRAVEGTSDWTHVECVFVSAGGEVMVNCLFGGGGPCDRKSMV